MRSYNFINLRNHFGEFLLISPFDKFYTYLDEIYNTDPTGIYRRSGDKADLWACGPVLFRDPAHHQHANKQAGRGIGRKIVQQARLALQEVSRI